MLFEASVLANVNLGRMAVKTPTCFEAGNTDVNANVKQEINFGCVHGKRYTMSSTA